MIFFFHHYELPAILRRPDAHGAEEEVIEHQLNLEIIDPIVIGNNDIAEVIAEVIPAELNGTDDQDPENNIDAIRDDSNVNHDVRDAEIDSNISATSNRDQTTESDINYIAYDEHNSPVNDGTSLRHRVHHSSDNSENSSLAS